MADYPWGSLKRPEVGHEYTGTLATPLSEHGVYWATSLRGQYCLMIRFVSESPPDQALPRLERLSVGFHPDGENRCVLLFTLEDVSLVWVFYDFCLGVIHVAEQGSSPKESVDLAIRHAFRWKRLLQGKGAHLSNEEQWGLLGELTFIRRRLRSHISWEATIASWQGPLGRPKDFQWSNRAVEVKTHLIASQPLISISSAAQLDPTGLDHLWMVIFDFSPTSPDATNGTTLTGYMNSCRDLIRDQAPHCLDSFDHRLEQYGYEPGYNHSPTCWQIGNDRAYQVDDSFPAIHLNSVPAGITSVSYRISLNTINHLSTGIASIFEEAI